MDYQDKNFTTIKSGLKKMISQEIWDYVELSDLQFNTVKIVVNAKNYDEIGHLFTISYLNIVFQQVKRKFLTKKKEVNEYIRKIQSEKENN